MTEAPRDFFTPPQVEIFKKEPKKKKSFYKQGAIGILIIAVVFVLGWPYLQGNITGASITGNDYRLETGLEAGSPYMGKKSAPVTIIEFSDFECPYCAKANSDALKKIRDTYVKDGKVKLIFRHLPLSFHANAEIAALASMCAAEQNKFWKYHDKLFENQGKLSLTYYRTLARELKLNTARFNTCLQSSKFKRQIESDKSAAQRVNFRGTPSFLINGERLTGALPISKFKEIIDKKLGN